MDGFNGKPKAPSTWFPPLLETCNGFDAVQVAQVSSWSGVKGPGPELHPCVIGGNVCHRDKPYKLEMPPSKSDAQDTLKFAGAIGRA